MNEALVNDHIRGVYAAHLLLREVVGRECGCIMNDKVSLALVTDIIKTYGQASAVNDGE